MGPLSERPPGGVVKILARAGLLRDFFFLRNESRRLDLPDVHVLERIVGQVERGDA
jgi:hypothetical protein